MKFHHREDKNGPESSFGCLEERGVAAVNVQEL